VSFSSIVVFLAFFLNSVIKCVAVFYYYKITSNSIIQERKSELVRDRVRDIVWYKFRDIVRDGKIEWRWEWEWKQKILLHF